MVTALRNGGLLGYSRGMTHSPIGGERLVAPARPRMSLRLGALASLLTLLVVATEVAAAPDPIVPVGDARRAKLCGGLPVAFAPRPLVGRAGHRAAAASEVPVLIELGTAATDGDRALLEAAGARLDGWAVARPGEAGRIVTARVSAAALAAVAALPRVRRVDLDGSPFGSPRPLDGTAAEVEATALWREAAPDGLPLTGAGMTICDVDSGVDVFHPMLFRADGGFRAWVDVDGNGAFSPGIDGVALDDSGVVHALRVLDGVITNYGDDTPLFGSEDPSFAAGLDWLYADLDGDGQRDFGRAGGFDDSSPSFGEPLFVADDVDGDGMLDRDEKLVGLGTSKIRVFRYNDEQYWRGTNLVDAPREQAIDHGTGASGVLLGGQRGLMTKVGLAPEAELIMATQGDAPTDLSYLLSRFCVEQGARVVLHEYAPWVGYHLDGSSQLERYIDTTTTAAPGVAHINPAGNLSGSQKLYKRAHPAGAQTDVEVLVPDDFYGGDFELIFLTLLWRDTSRLLSVALEDSTGYSRQLPTVDGEYIYEDWHDGLVLYAERSDSGRGTAKLDIYIWTESSSSDPLPQGTWYARVTDPTPAGAPGLDVIGYVMDELSGWGMGIHFPEHSSEEHLVGYPGTSDHGIAISAYTGYGTNGGTPGERASYSGRGHRIDGFELLDVAGPDDPVTAGYREGEQGRYFVYGGTSGASPHVAGVATLLLQSHPDWSGVQVTDALRAGALVDDATGSVPNDDWGYGKVRAYRSLFGEDPPTGSPPTIAVMSAQVERGEPTTITATVSDLDEPAANLLVELDREYDGNYEEQLTDASFEVLFDSIGSFVYKLRVTDSTGRQAATLARLTVIEPTDPPVEPTDPDETASVYPSGGCVCGLPGGHAPGAPWRIHAAILALCLATAARRHRQRLSVGRRR